MDIFKFGGAALKNTDRLIRVRNIIAANQQEKLLVVVSAMGDTTDLLEEIVNAAYHKKNFQKELGNLKKNHLNLCKGLSIIHLIEKQLDELFSEIENTALQITDRDKFYDSIVCFGEIISSKIVTVFFEAGGLHPYWLDARTYIQTDNTFREGRVLWKETEGKIHELKKSSEKLFITQGFIGSTAKKETTTLGREGSDFTAAIFGSCLNATSVTIWKDVAGVMSADPKRRPHAIIFDELPYKEAAEMTYYGASVIHPKTIKPLANKGIPLLVKCFLDPTLMGTKIHECIVDKLPPLIVHKENQCLVSCKVLDYTFVDELQIGVIFKALTDLNIRINVMQNSAISFSFCIDYREDKVLKLIEELSKSFEVYYNANLTLITIKNYDAKTSAEFKNMKGVILEQSSRSTLQVLVKI